MSANNTVKDNRKPVSSNTFFNAMQLMVDNAINKRVNTSELVKVTDVEPGGPGGAAGYVTVKPLVRQVDAKGQTQEPVELYKLPYARMQCGGAAIVMDPQPGDIGLACFTKRDSSGVKQEQEETVPPGSFRTFNQADGIFVGTMLNKAPETYVEMAPDEKRVTTKAPESAVVETKDFLADASSKAAIIAGDIATISGGSQVGISAPQVGISGNLSVSGENGGSGESVFTGNMKIIGNLTVTGSISVSGGISAQGDIVAGGVSLRNHTHSGVYRGTQNTNGPNGS